MDELEDVATATVGLEGGGGSVDGEGFVGLPMGVLVEVCFAAMATTAEAGEPPSAAGTVVPAPLSVGATVPAPLSAAAVVPSLLSLGAAVPAPLSAAAVVPALLSLGATVPALLSVGAVVPVLLSAAGAAVFAVPSSVVTAATLGLPTEGVEEGLDAADVVVPGVEAP